jgi:hypothetical protein
MFGTRVRSNSMARSNSRDGLKASFHLTFKASMSYCSRARIRIKVRVIIKFRINLVLGLGF